MSWHVLPDGITLDPNIWVPLVSVLVSVSVTLLIVFLVEPHKWRSRYEIKSLEKSVGGHGYLVSVLEACKEKAKRTPERPDKKSHLLEGDDVRKLEDIFEKRAYLLSKELRQTWYDFQAKDTTFLMDKTKHRDAASTAFGAKFIMFESDLAEMQRQAEDDLAKLRERYAGKTGIKH